MTKLSWQSFCQETSVVRKTACPAAMKPKSAGSPLAGSRSYTGTLVRPSVGGMIAPLGKKTPDVGGATVCGTVIMMVTSSSPTFDAASQVSALKLASEHLGAAFGFTVKPGGR